MRLSHSSKAFWAGKPHFFLNLIITHNALFFKKKGEKNEIQKETCCG
nr:MAG TPA: hypothetical protein [Caudoviricetes sp.]